MLSIIFRFIVIVVIKVTDHMQKQLSWKFRQHVKNWPITEKEKFVIKYEYLHKLRVKI